MNIDWSKAPEWAVGQGEVDEEGLSVWVGEDCYSYVVNPGSVFVWASSKANLAFRHRSELRNLIERPAQWNGEGLPPVGTVCEWHGPNSDGPNGWVYTESKVVAYTDDGLFACMQAPSCWPVVQRIDNCEFRPIRTPEQIAEEARIAELNLMIAAIKDYPGGRHGVDHLTQLQIHEEACINLYDAGWRKQVAIKLPEKCEYADSQSEYAKGHRQGKRDVVDCIEAAGLKVTP